MAVTEQQLSLQEFLRLPEDKPALEYEDGMVTQKVSSKGQHSTLQGTFVRLFDSFATPRKLAKAFPELRTTFAGASRVPDVSLCLWDRVPRDKRGRVANDFFEPPDLVVEIVSPEQSVNALVRRCMWYVTNGVRLALLIDSADDSILLFRPEQPPVALSGAERIDVSDLLPGFHLTVEELFASLRLE